MSKRPIQRLGAYLVADERGYLPERSRDARVAEPWATAVDALVRRYLREWGGALQGGYVRGTRVGIELAAASPVLSRPRPSQPDQGRECVRVAERHELQRGLAARQEQAQARLVGHLDAEDAA